MAKVQINARDQITATIKEKILEANSGDFTLPFASLSSAPKNASTGKAYRGLNSLYLCILGIETVATYKQWQSLGFQVVKGSSAIQLTPPPRTIKKQRDLPDGSKEDWARLVEVVEAFEAGRDATRLFFLSVPVSYTHLTLPTTPYV